MNEVNVALLTALYNGNSDLYKEIYFPIIKFALILSLKEAEDKRTTSVDNLHSKISQEFGISIPRVVLKKAILHLNKKDNALKVNLKGDDVFVNRADVDSLDDIYNRRQLVESSLRRLEQDYINYFALQGIIPEKRFSEFFAAHIQEIGSFLNNTDPETILNEEYSHNARYLLWLKEHDLELYESANKILWGATVAGFLGRDDYEFDVKPISRCRYYLDTAIVMGSLDLSHEQKTKYSQELIQVIKSSSSIACIHPMTLDEITGIIRGVESDGEPRLGTPIYEAFERRQELSCSKLTDIRLNLEEKIKNMGIDIYPERIDVEKLKSEYKGKAIVKDLEMERSDMGGGKLRDIHDAYMIDFVERERGKGSVREKMKAYFVTSNDDLRRFSARRHPSMINTLISPSSVVLDLWLHGVNLPSQIGQLSLTEIMSRCLALNEQSATSKIRQIFEYFDSEEMKDPKVRREVAKGVMERSNKYLLSDDENNQSNNTSAGYSKIYKQAELDIKQKELNIAETQNLRNENSRILTENANLENKVDRLEKKEERRKNLKKEKHELQDRLDKLTSTRRRHKALIVIEVIVNIITFVFFVFFPSKIALAVSVWKPEWMPILEEGNVCIRLLAWIILTCALYIAKVAKNSPILNAEKRLGNKRECNQIRDRLGEIDQEI